MLQHFLYLLASASFSPTPSMRIALDSFLRLLCDRPFPDRAQIFSDNQENASLARFIAGDALNLHPVWRSAGSIGSVPVFGDQAFQAQHTRMPKQIRSDLALFEVTQEDAIYTASQ